MKADWPIALVSLPFASLGPSLQLGLLKAAADAAKFPTTTWHLNLDFAKRIGLDEYEVLSEHRGVLVGEWLFSAAAFGSAAPDLNGGFPTEFGDQVDQLLEELGRDRGWLHEVRLVEVPRYLDELMTSINWNSFRVVGFTSTFQQNAASFALARRLKERGPELVTVFGGANFDGPMGAAWLEAIPWIDYVVVGEGENTLVEFVRVLADGGDPTEVLGVIGRRNSQVTALRPRPPLHQLDQLPFADFSEYFERDRHCFPDAKRVSAIPFESSRGCWWGTKQHCTFCGLNGSSIAYRSKSPSRVLQELEHYAKQYSIRRFEAVDNILDFRYAKQFFPKLIQQQLNYSFFYEVKANLKKEDIFLLHHAGVESLQPGIESLSTSVLKLMKKGITAIQNVNTLRWTRFCDIYVGWSILYGFPGEQRVDYDQQAVLVPLLFHLQAPAVATRIWIERFSPIFTDREAFPAKWLKPEKSYQYVYPRVVDLERAAYFFDGELNETLPDSDLKPLEDAVCEWCERWARNSKPIFTFTVSDHGVTLQDSRKGDHPTEEELTGLEAEIYVACSDQPVTSRVLRDRMKLPYKVSEVEKTLTRLTQGGWMMQDGEQFLSLALPGG